MERRAFFISPIGDEDSDDRKRFITVSRLLKICCESTGFDLITPLDFDLGAQITSEIMNALVDVDCCIADITGNNPNVMYELGVRRQSGGAYF